MPNLAALVRSQMQAKWGALPIVAQRHPSGIVLQNPLDQSKFSLSRSVGGKWHWDTGGGVLAEVDTDWQASAGQWDWQVTENDFESYVRDSVPVSYRYVDKATGHEIELTVNGVDWINDSSQTENGPAFGQVTPTINADKIRWPGIATGWDVQIEAQPTRLQKIVEIDSLANLGTPSLTGEVEWRMDLTFSKSNGLEVWVDGVLWDEKANNPQTTANDIEFRDSSTGETVFYFRRPKAWDSDSDGAIAATTLILRKQGANLRAEIRVPLTWLQSATYPVYIDPTIDQDVAASGDDGNSRGTSQFNNSGTRVDMGERSVGSFHPSNIWARFTGISGLSGATIDVSHLTLIGDKTTTGTPSSNTIYAEDAAAPAAPTSVSNYNSKTVTTASVNWNPTGVTNGSSEQSPSLNSIIQELADSYDPSVIQLLYKNTSGGGTNNYNTYKTYDQSAANAPALHIEYTAGASGVSVSDSVSLTESLDIDLLTEVDASDSISITEAVNLSQVYNVTVSDSISAAEAIDIDLVVEVVESETISVSEATDLDLSVEVAVSDSVSIAEDVVLTQIFTLDVSDSISVAEAVDLDLGIAIGVSDSISVAEAVSLLHIYDVNVSDTISVAETVDVDLPVEVVVSDSVSIAESVVLTQVFTLSVSDSISVAEGVDLDLSVEVVVSDSVSIAEGVNLAIVSAGEIAISVSDSISVAETVDLDLGIAIGVSDSISVAEAVDLDLSVEVVVSDSVSIAEGVNLAIVSAGEIAISVSDSISVAETVDLDLGIAIGVSDSISVAEAVDLVLVSHIITSDGISIAENVNLTQVYNPSVSDSISVAEAIDLDLVVEIAVTESASVAEAVNVVLVSDDTRVIVVSENVTVAEAIDLDLVVEIAVTEGVSVAETIGLAQVYNASASDAVSVAEAVNMAQVSHVTVSDGVVVAESVDVALPLGLVVSDSVSVAESVSLSIVSPGASLTIAVSDGVTLAETVNLVIVSPAVDVEISDAVVTTLVLSDMPLNGVDIEDAVVTSVVLVDL